MRVERVTFVEFSELLRSSYGAPAELLRSSSGAPTELIRSSSGALSVILYPYCVLLSGASLLAYKNIRCLYGSEKVKTSVHTRMIVYLVKLPILKPKLKQQRVSRCRYNLSPANAHRNFYKCENVAALC